LYYYLGTSQISLAIVSTYKNESLALLNAAHHAYTISSQYSEIAYCRSHWNSNFPNHCLIITEVMNGIYKFNSATGGMLLHLHTRYSSNGLSPPPFIYPSDVFSPYNNP